MSETQAIPQDLELAQKVVDYLNGLLERDPHAIAALIENRVACNAALRDHPSCQVQVSVKDSSCQVGFLGLLNGLCGIDEMGMGLITAVFDNPDDELDAVAGMLDLVKFRITENLFLKKKREAEGGN